MLAVGSRDNNIYIYNVSQNYKLSGICRGHSSFISHIDWNQDNTMIQTNDGAYELLYWNAETCKQHTSKLYHARCRLGYVDVHNGLASARCMEGQFRRNRRQFVP